MLHDNYDEPTKEGLLLIIDSFVTTLDGKRKKAHQNSYGVAIESILLITMLKAIMEEDE